MNAWFDFTLWLCGENGILSWCVSTWGQSDDAEWVWYPWCLWCVEMFACDEPDVTAPVGMFELICKLSQLKNERCTVFWVCEHARAREEDLSVPPHSLLTYHDQNSYAAASHIPVLGDVWSALCTGEMISRWYILTSNGGVWPQRRAFRCYSACRLIVETAWWGIRNKHLTSASVEH